MPISSYLFPSAQYIEVVGSGSEGPSVIISVAPEVIIDNKVSIDFGYNTESIYNYIETKPL